MGIIKRLVFLLISFCLIYVYFTKKEVIQDNNIKIVKCLRSNGELEDIELEDYVLGVLSAEMPASFELEALKAQAVAARTFVMSRNLTVDDTTSSQVYHDEAQRQEKWQDLFSVYESKLQEAVNETKGEVLMYNGQYISALFFSSSNGMTENNEDYFTSNALPYLRCVSSEYEVPLVERVTYTYDELASLLGTPVYSMNILNYTESGRVNEVSVNGEIYSGRDIRELLNLNSSDFDIEVENGGFSFTTFGFGHGVGMSQYGANGMAQNGYTYDEILKHYYQGASINQIK